MYSIDAKKAEQKSVYVYTRLKQSINLYEVTKKIKVCTIALLANYIRSNTTRFIYLDTMNVISKFYILKTIHITQF